MSIIETAYAEALAARLCARVEALDVATAAYQTTGIALVAAQAELRQVEWGYEEVTTTARAAYLSDPDLSTNDKARAAKLARLLHDDPNVAVMREHLGIHQARYDQAERAHKNAYHEMESLRVAINGFAAVLGVTR